MNGHTLNNPFVASMNHLKVMLMDEKKRSRLCCHQLLTEAMMRNVEVQMMDSYDIRNSLRRQSRNSREESEKKLGRTYVCLINIYSGLCVFQTDDDCNTHNSAIGHYHVLCRVIPCHTMSYHVIPCHTMSWHSITCHRMTRHGMSW